MTVLLVGTPLLLLLSVYLGLEMSDAECVSWLVPCGTPRFWLGWFFAIAVFVGGVALLVQVTRPWPEADSTRTDDEGDRP